MTNAGLFFVCLAFIAVLLVVGWDLSITCAVRKAKQDEQQQQHDSRPASEDADGSN